MIEIRTVNTDVLTMQRIIILKIFFVGVSFQGTDGQHFGFHWGVGPIEMSFVLRLWNGSQE